MTLRCLIFGHDAERDRRHLREHCRRCDLFSPGFHHEADAKIHEQPLRVIYAKPDGRERQPTFRVWSRRRVS